MRCFSVQVILNDHSTKSNFLKRAPKIVLQYFFNTAPKDISITFHLDIIGFYQILLNFGTEPSNQNILQIFSQPFNKKRCSTLSLAIKLNNLLFFNFPNSTKSLFSYTALRQ